MGLMFGVNRKIKRNSNLDSTAKFQLALHNTANSCNSLQIFHGVFPAAQAGASG